MKDTRLSWWVNKPRDDFYREVAQRTEATRASESRFGAEGRLPINTGKPKNLTLKVSD